MPQSSWQSWEHEIAEKFGLSTCIASGNQFQDPGDAVDRSNPHEEPFRLLVDGKFTEAGSFSLNVKKLMQWFDKGVEVGKRAVIAVRLWPRGLLRPVDVVVLDANDFAELLEKARAWDDRPECPTAGNMCNCTGACRVPKSQFATYQRALASPNFSGFGMA